jgi:hypothetical protein
MTDLGDLSEPMTWPSLIVKNLNEDGVWKDKIKILEIEKRKPINLYSFAKYALLQRLLKPRFQHGQVKEYTGPLYKYAKFDFTKSVNWKKNKQALQKQSELLKTYFNIVKKIVSDNTWENSMFGLTKTTGVNALLLVLQRILETKKSFDELKIGKFLLPVKNIDFKNETLKRYGRGWDSYTTLANMIIDKLNQHNTIKLKKF